MVVTEKDGNQPVDFYWIDSLLSVVQIAGKSKYVRKLYLQFEPEESWKRAVICACSRVNDLVFESAYLID